MAPTGAGLPVLRTRVRQAVRNSPFQSVIVAALGQHSHDLAPFDWSYLGRFDPHLGHRSPVLTAREIELPVLDRLKPFCGLGNQPFQIADFHGSEPDHCQEQRRDGKEEHTQRGHQ